MLLWSAVGNIDAIALGIHATVPHTLEQNYVIRSFSSVTSGDVSSKDSDSPALAFLQDIGQFHKDHPIAALSTDAALAVGAVISLTPEGRKIGSIIMDEAANAGRGFMKAGDDLWRHKC